MKLYVCCVYVCARARACACVSARVRTYVCVFMRGVEWSSSHVIYGEILLASYR